MRYFCITHQPLPWPVPGFMEPVSTVPAGADVLDLGERYPELAGRGPVLSEYATLFAVRRMLQGERDGKGPVPGEMVGIAHYRRFAVTKPVGTPSFVYGLLTPDAFRGLSDDMFLPPEGTLVLPAPATLTMPIVTQYGAAHHLRDLLHYMAIAVDLGVVDEKQLASFLGQNSMIPAPTVGIYPAEWLVDVLERLEEVVDAFEANAAVAHDGYQRRAAGFCTERLHALLLLGLVPSWPQDRIVASRPVVVTEDQQYRDGG